MILNTLRLENYKQYSHLELEFREGLVGVIGKNGAGKSTLFDAILFCLFGREEGNKAHVRSTFSEPKSTVLLELSFNIGEVGYLVRREFRGKALAVGAEFFKNDVQIAKGVSAVNEELVKVLQMERDAFKRSVFSGQKELSQLSDTAGEARKRMVRRMLGLDTLDDIQARVNADLRDWSSQAVGQQQNLLSEEALKALQTALEEREKVLEINRLELKEAQSVLSELQVSYQKEQGKFDAEEARFKRHSALQNDWTQTQERLEGGLAQQKNLRQKETDLLEQKKAQEAVSGEFGHYEAEKKQLESMETERQRHVNQSARQTKILETKELLTSVSKKITSYAADLTARTAVEAQLAEQQTLVSNLESEMEARRSELRQIEQKIGGIQSSVRERSEKLEKLKELGNEGNCPTCLQPLLEGYEKALSELDTEIKALQTNQLQQLESQKKAVVEDGLALKNQQTKAREAVTEHQKTQTRLAEIQRQLQTETHQKKVLEDRLAADELILREIGEVHFNETAYIQLKTKLNAQETRYRAYLAQENYLSREWPSTQTSLQTTQESITTTQQRRAALQVELNALAYDEARYTEAKQALAQFTQSFQNQSDVCRGLEKIGFEFKNEQSTATEKIRVQNQILANISDKLQEVELLRKLTELLGLFKTEILEKISPGISREASHLFSRITRGKYEGILVDENFDFSITDGGVYYPIERFSGGEVDLANFCLRIAITKAIMDLSGSGQRLEFLAFDEIFGSQDEDRRLEMMQALHFLQEQFRQIYIVSHIDSLKDFFPHLLEVQLRETGSAAVWR